MDMLRIGSQREFTEDPTLRDLYKHQNHLLPLNNGKVLITTEHEASDWSNTDGYRSMMIKNIYSQVWYFAFPWKMEIKDETFIDRSFFPKFIGKMITFDWHPKLESHNYVFVPGEGSEHNF